MLRVSQLSASYGAAPVLQGVSLHVERSETIALLGPNGAGKSTLLAAITGTIAQRAGSIQLDGVELAQAKSHAIVGRGVALVPEGRLVFAPFTVEDNLRLGAIRLKGTLAERYDYVYGLFPRLRERRRQSAGTLSGGEQQMLAIGRCLMGRPRLMMLDEPSLGLAPITASGVFRAVVDLNRIDGLAIVLVEQNVAQSLAMAHRGYVLETGQIVGSGTGPELLRNDDVRRAYIGA
jgi:branched-chain amino acid transport system ATP-binding protein